MGWIDKKRGKNNLTDLSHQKVHTPIVRLAFAPSHGLLPNVALDFAGQFLGALVLTKTWDGPCSPAFVKWKCKEIIGHSNHTFAGHDRITLQNIVMIYRRIIPIIMTTTWDDCFLTKTILYLAQKNGMSIFFAYPFLDKHKFCVKCRKPIDLDANSLGPRARNFFHLLCLPLPAGPGCPGCHTRQRGANPVYDIISNL